MFESNTTLSLRMPNGVRTEILCASDPSFSRSQFGGWPVWTKMMRAEKHIIHAVPHRPAIRRSSDSRLMCHAADHLRPLFFCKNASSCCDFRSAGTKANDYVNSGVSMSERYCISKETNTGRSFRRKQNFAAVRFFLMSYRVFLPI